MILPLVELCTNDIVLPYHHEAVHHGVERSPWLPTWVSRSLKSDLGVSFLWLKREAGTEDKVQNLY